MNTVRIALWAALVVVGFGCFPKTPPPPTSSLTTATPAKIADLPLRITVRQRSTVPVPGTNGELSITIDDITRDQVMVNLIGKDGSPLFGPVSMKDGDSRSFRFENVSYSIRLAEMKTALIGDDFASFVIAEPLPDTLTEDEKIDRLIATVEALEDARFVRNDVEYTAQDAADHLRRKRAAAGGQVRTASEFIEQIASKSSVSGKEYEIRFADGNTIRARDFLFEELADLQTSP